MRLTPLTVGFHERQFLGIVNAENQELLQFGQPAQWDKKTRREHNAPMGPVNPQALNRYAYCLNNPLRYVDPSGHNSGGNEVIGYTPLLDSEGNILKDSDGVTIYRIWHDGEEMYVRGDCPYLADFKRYADDYADGLVERSWGNLALYGGAIGVGLGIGTLTFGNAAASPTVVGIPVVTVVGVLEVVGGGMSLVAGIGLQNHASNQIEDSYTNAYRTFWGEIGQSKYNVTHSYTQSGPFKDH
jgi:hypothetical protein